MDDLGRQECSDCGSPALEARIEELTEALKKCASFAASGECDALNTLVDIQEIVASVLK
jgi:hypothetical protein